jgi:hypothetical protein
MDGNPKQILISEEPLNVHFLDLDLPHDFQENSGRQATCEAALFSSAATFVGIGLLGARLTKNGAANFSFCYVVDQDV